METTTTTDEQWRPWRDGTYEVSDLGLVRRVHATRTTKRLHVLAPYIDPRTGYAVIGLRDEHGVRTTRSMHRVVAEAWYGLCPPGKEVNHIDGVRSNNAPANLEYVTHSANIRDAVSRLRDRGELFSGAKLDAGKVRSIRQRYAGGESGAAIARSHGLHRTTITAITRGETWRHLV